MIPNSEYIERLKDFRGEVLVKLKVWTRNLYPLETIPNYTDYSVYSH